MSCSNEAERSGTSHKLRQTREGCQTAFIWQNSLQIFLRKSLWQFHFNLVGLTSMNLEKILLKEMHFTRVRVTVFMRRANCVVNYDNKLYRKIRWTFTRCTTNINMVICLVEAYCYRPIFDELLRCLYCQGLFDPTKVVRVCM